MSFTSLGLSDLLSETIKTLYTTPTTLQEQAIPIILQNNDLMVAAQAGTGETGSFALPIIEKLFPNGSTERHPAAAKQSRVLILVSTQEEAIQVTDYFKACAFDFPLSIACVLDSVSITPQIKILGRGVDVLIACPNRLLELVAQEAVDLSAVEIFVLDQADLLTNSQAIQTTKQVIEKLPSARQNLLFTSTFTDDVIVLAHFLLKNPERIEITPAHNSVSHIKQTVFYVPTRQKSALLAHLISKNGWSQALVFTRTKHGASRLASYLNQKGITSATIHGNKTLNARNKAINDFKEQQIQILIATDIDTQSLDVNQLPCVINFDLPYIEDDYVQRINCTSSIGEAVSLVSTEEEKLLLVIESYINQKIDDGDMQDFIFDESEVVVEEPERFRRIFRHPAVGRKSRKKQPEKSPINQLDEPISAETVTEDILDQKPVRSTKPARNTQTRTPKGTRNPYNKHRRTTVSLDNMPPDRPEDEFRDDEYDNFGNSVDYISPYQNKSKPGLRNKQFTANNTTPSRTTNTTATPATPSTTSRPYKPKTARVAKTADNNAQQQEQRRPRNSLYRRNNNRSNYASQQDRDTTPVLSEPREPVQKRTSTTTPAIIHRKHPRIDRLPTIEQLDSMPNRHITKTEKPALLTRKNTDE